MNEWEVGPADPRTIGKRLWPRRIAAVLRWLPLSGKVLQQVMRLVQPRYTLGVVGVLMDTTGTRVLLVEHVFHPRRPWGLPGGWMNRGEDPTQAVEREFHEEIGLRVCVIQPVLIRGGTRGRHINVAFLVRLAQLGQQVRLSSELLRWGWTPVDDLPPLMDFHEQAIRTAGVMVAHRAMPFQEDGD